uniref:Uncharacterized protein n=1 Tax=Anopheles culicifacies TaxID=139723 RepID=A0A182M6C3_9DIPT
MGRGERETIRIKRCSRVLLSIPPLRSVFGTLPALFIIAGGGEAGGSRFDPGQLLLSGGVSEGDLEVSPSRRCAILSINLRSTIANRLNWLSGSMLDTPMERVGTILQQQLHYILVTTSAGQRKRRVIIVRRVPINVSTPFDQKLHYAPMAGAARFHERCATALRFVL